MKRVLIGYERSGAMRRAFRAAGHVAFSCDLAPAEDGGQHIQADVFDVLGFGWDLAIFHPVCTYLCSSGLHWNKRRPERAALTERAVAEVERLREASKHIPRRAFENPIGCLSTRWRKPDQIVHPYMFGDDASKATCWWVEGLPLLQPLPRDQWAPPRVVNGKTRWANQTDSGQNKLPPSDSRAMERARTYPGMAAAAVRSWCQYLAQGSFLEAAE